MLDSWKDFFVKHDLMDAIENLIAHIYQPQAVIYPPKDQLLHLFDLIAPADVKVIILGQDPYHNPHQANGVAFSASNDVSTPKSLTNIFKELTADLQIEHYDNNDLSGWVKQGVLLINTSWTVKANQPASHAKIGWNQIVVQLLQHLNTLHPQLIYCVWGKSALQIVQQLQVDEAMMIVSPHPSPFSYYKGFAGSKPFSKINQLLKDLHQPPIDWSK